jgi:hypothetical protein
MKVILISGKAQHGKDTSAIFMKEALELEGRRVLIAHYGDLVKFICEKYFGWDGKKDEKGRSLLQYVGTDVVRKQKPDFWVNFVCEVLEMFSDQWDRVIIPDCRFPNEIECFVSRGFDVTHVRVIRPDFDNGLTPEQQRHLSETALDGCVPDLELLNDGSLDDLRGRIFALAGKL